MNAKVNSEGSKFDLVKWLVVVAILAVGIVGNSIYADQSLFLPCRCVVGFGACCLVLCRYKP